MSIYITVLFGLLFIFSIRRGTGATVILFFCMLPFGAFSVVSPSLIGGFTISPSVLAAVYLCLTLLYSPSRIRASLGVILDNDRLGLLFLFLYFAIVITIISPRYFSGQIQVVPVSLTYNDEIRWLAPISQNISQLVYLALSVFFTLFVVVFCHYRDNIRIVLKGIYLGAWVLVVSGLLDFINIFFSLDYLLSAFKNSTYAIADNQITFGGVKRLSGLMPEPSAFGSLVVFFLAMIYFLRDEYQKIGFQKRHINYLLISLIAGAALSTSSTAIAGLIVFFLMASLQLFLQSTNFSKGDGRKTIVKQVSLVSFAVALLFLGYFQKPDLYVKPLGIFQVMIIDKKGSTSFDERSQWNRVSWQALVDSNFLGVGVGSTRASNSFVATIVSVGVLGGLVYYLFLAKAFSARLSPRYSGANSYFHGLKFSLVPILIMSLLSGTSANFGFGLALIYGMIVAAKTSRETLIYSN